MERYFLLSSSRSSKDQLVERSSPKFTLIMVEPQHVLIKAGVDQSSGLHNLPINGP